MALIAESFDDVTVSFPSKPSVDGRGVEDADATWVPLGKGRLSADRDSFLLIFRMAGAGATSTKPLGSLVRARQVSQDSLGLTVVINTTEPIHPLLRVTFPSASSAHEFSRLAELAAATSEAQGRRAQRLTVGERAEKTSSAEKAVALKFKHRSPIIYGSAEFYGVEHSGAGEVRVGAGVVVLLDPAETESMLIYEVAFFDEEESVGEPARRFEIHPRMELQLIRHEEDGETAGTSVDISQAQCPSHSLIFENEDDAAGFARDFRVRLRLMRLASKTVRGRREVSAVSDEIQRLKNQMLSARVARALRWFIVLVVVLMCLRCIMVFSGDRQRSLAGTLIADVRWFSTMSSKVVAAASAGFCELVAGAPPPSKVLRCAALGSTWEIRRCLESLVGRLSL